MRSVSERVPTFLPGRALRAVPAWLPCLLLLLLAAPGLVRAQTQCAGQSTCANLQIVTTGKIPGPIKYRFDQDRLLMLSPADRADFISRFNAAAAEWSRLTGISISEAGAGDAAQVRVRVGSATLYQNVNGRVEPDPNTPGGSGTMITFSSVDYPFWSSEGKDRLMFHEIGHLLGFDEVPADGCPGVETIMRQTSRDNDVSERQLRNGYGCASGGTCPASDKLPQPPKPNACDVEEAKDKKDKPPDAPGDEGDGGGDPCAGDPYCNDPCGGDPYCGDDPCGGDPYCGEGPECEWIEFCVGGCYPVWDCYEDYCGDSWCFVDEVCDPQVCEWDCVY